MKETKALLIGLITVRLQTDDNTSFCLKMCLMVRERSSA